MTKDYVKPKKKSLTKKIFIGVGILFLLVLIAAFTIPYFFKDDIKAFVNKEINDNINAKVDFDDISISLFKSFPNLNTGIENFKINGIGEFREDSLFYAEKVNLDMDILSLFSDKIKITDFSVIKPVINIKILPSGKANYDIIKQDNSSGEESKLKDIALKHYSVIDATINVTDLQTNKKIEIKGLNHQGRGDFEDVVFGLNTETSIDELSFASDNIYYLKKAKLDWDIDFDADLNKMLFKIKENTLSLNALKLLSEGQFQFDDKYADIDLHINAPGNNFKEIFSIIPGTYTKDYNNVKAKGTFKLNGDIKGKYYFDNEIYPDFNMNLIASNGYIKYPDLPLPIESINANIKIDKKGKSLNNTIVKVNPLTFLIQKDKMEMVFDIKNLLQDPLSQGKLKGTINLDALSKAFPVQDFKEMTGKLTTDVKFKFNRSQSYQQLAGKAEVDNIKIKYSDLPKVDINDAKIDFTTKKITVNDLKMKAGKSDIAGSITISNPLHYFTKNKTTGLNIAGESNFFDADEWTGNDTKGQDTNPQNDENTLDFLKNRLKVVFDYRIQKLKYEDYDIKNMYLNGEYFDNILTINNQNLVLSDSKLNITGKLENILSWLMQDKTLSGVLNVNSPHFDMDKFMGEDDTNGKNNSSGSEDFTIPDKMDLVINTNISKVNYTEKDLRNLKGKLKIKNQSVTFDDFNAQGMGGTMIVNGIFSTPPGKKPEFDIRYRMSKMKYEEMYKSVVSFKTLAPLSEFIRGVFNADFSFKGKLSDGFMPDFTSITAKGLIHTINAYIKNYPGLNSLASKLQVSSLDNMEIKDTKNSFEINDGTVKINPFDYEYDDMKFNVSGLNKLDKTIDYIIHAKIPKSKIGKLPGGNKLNKGLDYIVSQAKSKGFNIEVGDILNLDITLTGKYNKPKLRIKFVGTSGGSVKNTVDNAINDTKKEIKNEIEKKKQEAKTKTNEVIDSTKKKIKKKVKDTEKELKDKAKKELEKQKAKAKKKVKDALKDLWK